MKMLPFILIGMWIWIIAVAVVVSLSLSGCLALGPRLGQFTYVDHAASRAPIPMREIPIWVDANFGEADQLLIDDAVNAWNYALNGYVHLTVVDRHFNMEVSKIVEQVRKGGWLFLRIRPDNTLIPVSPNGYRVLGFTEMVGGQHLWLVRDRITNEDVFGITLHEIGHLLGARHIGSEHLMYPYYTRARYQCIDKESLSEVAVYYGLFVDKLNYCVDGDTVPDAGKDAGENKHLNEPGCPTGS